jgi:hypothetical protein
LLEDVRAIRERVLRDMNVRKILRETKVDPLRPLLGAIRPDGHAHPLARDDLALYAEAYQLYYFSLERLLKEMSLARRFRNGPYYALKYGMCYTAQEKNLARRFHQSKHYFWLDFVNFMIHSRILLDRAISLSKYFLAGKQLPSFASFSQHKRFFQKPEHRPYGKHEPYARHICDTTDWFEKTLKTVRDKFLVHAQSQHRMSLGSTDLGPAEIKMIIQVPRGSSDRPFVQIDVIMVSVPELVEDMGRFLKFFSTYALAALRRKQKT